jgi:hypothetical protein
MSSTIVDLPDGSSIDVDTSDPKVAAAAARKYMQARASKARPSSKLPKAPPLSVRGRASKPRGAVDTFLDFTDTVADNVLPNWGDELRGSGRAFRALLKGEDAGAAFVEGQRSFKRDQARFKRGHPTASMIAAGTGMGAGMVLPVGKAVKGASLLRKAGQGAKVGAAYGALAGAGEGEGLDPGRRTTNAAQGAVAGGATGAVLPFAARGASHLTRTARERIPGVDAVVRTLPKVPRAVIQAATGKRQPASLSAGEQQANRLAARTMERGNISVGLAVAGPPATPQAIQAEVARRNAVGVPAMIGDATPEMRELTRQASSGMGPGQRMVRERLEARKVAEAARVRQHVQDTLPTTPDPIAFAEQQRRSARDAVAPLYDEAYALPMYRTEAVQAIEKTPAFRKALPQAYENIQNQIDPVTGAAKEPYAVGFRDMPNVDPNGLPPNGMYFPHPSGGGFVTMDDGLTVEGYDQVARAMQDMGRAAGDRNPVTGRIENTTNSVHINARAGELRDHLRRQNAPYDAAVGRYGDDMAYVQAFDNGQRIGDLTGHEVNALGRSMPQAAHEAFATGAGTAMADAASQHGARHPIGDTSNRVRQMLGDDTKQQALGEIGGSSGAVSDLLERLEYEAQANANWQALKGRSPRPEIDSELEAAGGLPTSKAGMVGGLLNYIVARATPRYRQDLKNRLGEIVTASDAQSVEDVMQAIHTQALRDGNFSDLMHRSGIATTSVYGANVAPADAVDWEGGR